VSRTQEGHIYRCTVEKIVKIRLKIKDSVDTVRHNQEECNEIRKRALRFSAILSQLQQTGMMEGSPALSGALEEGLQHALELVMACQETSTIRRLITAGDLSKKLRGVKEDILKKVMLACGVLRHQHSAQTTIVLLSIPAGGDPLRRQPEVRYACLFLYYY
jgi:L1 cell adhesion molecule like protein